MNETVYYQALSIVHGRRDAAIESSKIRKNELKAKIPEIKEVYLELERTSSLVLASFTQSDGSLTLEEIKARNIALQKKKTELLVSHGFPPDYDSVKYSCEKCGDSGYVGLDMCSCLKTELSRLRLEQSEISKLGSKQSFDNFSLKYYPDSEKDNIKFNFDCLKRFACGFNSESKDNWLLIGGTGLGKTHLSTAVGIEVINRGYSVVYKSIQGIIDDMERVHFKHEDNSVTDPYYECDLLIIDDLGTELSNQFTLSVVYTIINTRISSEKPMLINTNLNQKELRDIYADRITSRLFGEFKPLLFRGTDVRRLKLNNEN